MNAQIGKNINPKFSLQNLSNRNGEHQKYFTPGNRLTCINTKYEKRNKSWRQHPTRHQLYGHLPPITKTIQVRRTRHAGHCWRSKDELISDVLLRTPTYGCAKAGQPARTYIQQLCEDTRCNPEDLPEAMNDWEKWRERVRDIRAGGATWWWWWWWTYTHANITKAQTYDILINEKWNNSALNWEAYSSFEGVSNHRIVTAKIRPSLRRNAARRTTTVHYDWLLLDNRDIRDKYTLTLWDKFYALQISETPTPNDEFENFANVH